MRSRFCQRIVTRCLVVLASTTARPGGPLKNAVVAFFSLAKCGSLLRTARSITTYVAILSSHPCDVAACRINPQSATPAQPLLRATARQPGHATQAGPARLVAWQHEAPVPGTSQRYLTTADGRRRRYLLHVPPNFDGSRAWPLVLAFHGGGGRAETLVRQSRLDQVADKYGFLVAYPDGTGRLRMLTFNAGTCCGYAVSQQVNDVAFVGQLLDELARTAAIDPRRVYATGMSNGAMLCYRLACELSDRIAAIAPVAGDLGVEGPVPRRPVPVLHFHGLADQNVQFAGGLGSNQYEKTPHRSIPDTLAFWLRANGCAAEPVAVEESADFIRQAWAPPAGNLGAPVVLYKLPRGGHTWPGGVDVSRWLGTGAVVEAVDASTLMWQFFRQFSLP